MKSYFKALNVARARRAMGLVLKWDMDWCTCGVYRLRTDDNKLMLLQPCMNTNVEIPKHMLKALGGQPDKLWIDRNWSETEAVLVGPKSQQLCILLISAHTANNALEEFNEVTIPQLICKLAPSGADQHEEQGSAKEEPPGESQRADSEDKEGSEGGYTDVDYDDYQMQLALIAAAEACNDGSGLWRPTGEPGGVKEEVKTEADHGDGSGAVADAVLATQDATAEDDVYDESQMSLGDT